MYKYLKYKNKYTNLRGGTIKIKSLKNIDFKTYIMYLRDTYISNRHENGGIISINNQEYTITYNSDNYDSVDGNILYDVDLIIL
jgi:diacylglycerol kinase family enzyme